MSRRQAIEAALAAWRDADRRLADAIDGDRAAIARQVELHRSDFQLLSAAHMVERTGGLTEAGNLPIHEAAHFAGRGPIAS